MFPDLLIDHDDEWLVHNYTWGFSSHGYLRRAVVENGRQRIIYLHREIMGLGPGDPLVDHINGNKLDNRKCNLRLATKSQNAHNTKRKGVYFDKRDGRYYAHCRVNGIRHSLGGHSTRKKAEKTVSEFRRMMGL